MSTTKKSESLDERVKRASLHLAAEIADLVRQEIAGGVAQMLGVVLHSVTSSSRHPIAKPTAGEKKATKHHAKAARQKRQPMSDAQKKALSQKMKARWAARKAAKAPG